MMGCRGFLVAFVSVGFVACCSGARAQQQVIGAPPEALNMRLVGTNDLQGAPPISRRSIIRATAGSPISAITAVLTLFPIRSIR